MPELPTDHAGLEILPFDECLQIGLALATALLSEQAADLLDGVLAGNEIRFEPQAEGQSLYRGTLWVERRTLARVQVQAVQTGLSAPVVSNEETQIYEPVAAVGNRPVFLFTRLDAKQIMLIAGRNLLVEKRVAFGDFRVNDEKFADARLEARRSDRIMYRETDRGLRYYVKEGDQRVVSEEIMQGVREALGLDQLDAFDLPEAAHDAVARADQHRRIGIDGARARHQLAHEAVVQTVELLLLRLVQAQVRAALPEPQGKVADLRLLDLTEPAERARRQAARNAVGQQKEQLLLKSGHLPQRLLGHHHHSLTRFTQRGLS